MSYTEASYYEKHDNGTVQCLLCPHECLLRDGRTGICGIRRNSGGILQTAIYGEVTSMAVDPMEKKPLYHFYPGAGIFSIGTKGCNLKCPYCQNWSISQEPDAPSSYRPPEEIVKRAAASGSVGIAYTYSEPVIWFEYVRDTALLAREKGLKNVLVTNGFVNPAPLNELTGFIDAMNIDLKCFSTDSYKRYHRGDLDAVKRTIHDACKAGCHVEVTTLAVTGINDSKKEMQEIAMFLASIDRRIPWHISRYYPSYRHNTPATDIGYINDVWESVSGTLDFVFTGNIHPYLSHGDTVCPNCHTVVIARRGYSTEIKALAGGACAKCGCDLKIIH